MRATTQTRRFSRTATTAERAPEVINELRENGVSLDELSGRLAVRLGPNHEVVQHFETLTDAIYRIFGKVRMPAHVLDHLEPLHAIEEQSQRFDAARKDFLAAAAKVAGARLDNA